MTAYEPGDRRPIASRERTIWKRTATALARAGVTANAISLFGMIAGLASGVLLALTAHSGAQRIFWIAGAALIQLRLLCNMLDGMVALESHTASPVGELYNEVPDRISDTATLVGLGYAAGGDPTIGLAAALLAIFTAYVRAVGKGGGAGSDFSGPMAKPHRMFTATVASLYCGLAPVAWQPLWHGYGIAALALAIICIGAAVTASRRLLHISDALRRRT